MSEYKKIKLNLLLEKYGHRGYCSDNECIYTFEEIEIYLSDEDNDYYCYDINDFNDIYLCKEKVESYLSSSGYYMDGSGYCDRKPNPSDIPPHWYKYTINSIEKIYDSDSNSE
jgi:hypothetical protein